MMAQMKFNFYKMGEIINALLDGNISYHIKGMEGKVQPLDKSANKITRLDCSGFVQYVIYKTSIANIRLPAGSDKQRSEINGSYPKVGEYKDAAKKIDGIVRIAFRKTISRKIPDPKNPGEFRTDENGKFERVKTQIGHVWLIINGKTFESKGKIGPTSLDWNKRTSDEDYGCFVLGPLVVPKCPRPLDYYLSLIAEKNSIIGAYFKTFRVDLHATKHHDAPLSHERIGSPAEWQHYYDLPSPVKAKKSSTKGQS